MYIDCMRGAAMFMVVYSHVLTFMMGRIEPSSLGQYMENVMLPLFFFISGFCAYKADRKWTHEGVKRQLTGKIRAVLLPTVVMFMLFMLYSGQNAAEVVFHYDKNGYWFTWVLFQILMVFLLVDIIGSKVERKWVKAVVMASPLVVFAVVFRYFGYDSQAARLFEWVKVVGNYYFFLAGAILRLFQPNIDKVLANKYVPSLLLIISTTVFCMNGGGKMEIVSVVLIYYIFHGLEGWLSQPRNKLSKILSTIGRNTLEVYFIHFFLLFAIPILPYWLTSLKSDICFGTNSCSSLPEFIIVGTISTGLCYACIAVKKLIGLFPPIYELCFGSQKK